MASVALLLAFYAIMVENTMAKLKYISTSVTSVHEMENGFNIWSFNGKLPYRIPRDHFYQVTNDIFTREDGEFLVKDCALPKERFVPWKLVGVPKLLFVKISVLI